MRGYSNHTFLVIPVAKLAGKATLVEPEIKAGIVFYGGQVREEGYEKSVFDFGWLSKSTLVLGKPWH
jgi:hypothetical protein